MTYEDRCHISALLQAKHSVLEISKALGFHKTSIYREIRRNQRQKSYAAGIAQTKAKKRFKQCRRPKLMTPELKEYVLGYAAFGWSAEQISMRLRREKKIQISYQTIYRSFYQRQRGWDIIHQRRPRTRGGRSCQRAKRAQKVLSIHERPWAAERRSRIGDWERDGMFGANRQQLLVLTDRKTRFTKLEKIKTGKSKDVGVITKQILEGLNKKVHTITNDNGTEFNDAKSLPWKTYYCDPHKPQQRGTVENTIGLLRQYIKRNTDLDKLTDEDLRRIENRINFRPRKCLDYKTPFEAFYKLKVALAM
tara:strand:+ start:86 stop:1006 length:921 start_codon:yes stop_codon:yes gene_type:complete